MMGVCEFILPRHSKATHSTRRALGMGFAMLAGLILSACAGGVSQRAAEANRHIEQAARELPGQSVRELLQCAGMPNATVGLENGHQLLIYARQTSQLEIDPFHEFYTPCGWPTYNHRCFSGAAPDYYLRDYEIVEHGCRVGFWVKDEEIHDMSVEATSGAARNYCVEVFRNCLKPDETAINDDSKRDKNVTAGGGINN